MNVEGRRFLRKKVKCVTSITFDIVLEQLPKSTQVRLKSKFVASLNAFIGIFLRGLSAGDTRRLLLVIE